MATPILYSMELSPPCRGVLLAAEAAGINLDIQETNLIDKEHLTEEYMKMNPQHTVPTLNDNGFFLSDSHAIVTYLIDKYGKDDSLYPKDLQKRALVNQFLHFNNSVLFSNLKGICYPLVFDGATAVSEERLKLLKAGCGFLEKYLENSDWLVGDRYTLADTSVISTVSGFPICLSFEKYPKLAAWMKRCEDQLPGYAKANAPGNTQFVNYISECIAKL